MTWYWFTRDRQFRVHPRGIANYADKAAALITADGDAQFERAEHRVSDLLSNCQALGRQILQKWNKLRDLGRPDKPFESPVTPETYEDMSLRIARGRWVRLGLILGEGFLNYLALLVVIPGDKDVFLVVARAVIATVVTLIAFKVFHFALNAWDPAQESADRRVKWATAVLAALMLVSIGGVTTARARDFEGGDRGIGIVGWGFILASLILPIVGGVIEFELGRLQPLHRRLVKWRASLKELRRFEGRMQKDLQAIDNLLETAETKLHEEASRMYAGVVHFRVLKQNLDARRGKELESLAGTSASDHATFLRACLFVFQRRKTEFVGSISGRLTELRDLVQRSIESSTAVMGVQGGGTTQADP